MASLLAVNSPSKNGALKPHKDFYMIIFVEANLKEIFNLKKNYKWPRPKICPECKGHKVWGHGFVLANFDGFKCGLYIKKYRCPDCRAVIRMRPKGYFPRFQTSIKTIRSSILNKSSGNGWIKNLCRSRQQHWFRALIRKVNAFLGNNCKNSVVENFDYFISKKISPVCRSFKSAENLFLTLPTEELHF